METQIVIEFILLLIGLYLAFFKSYLTEKGKSVALKEDITDLTRKVESVKNEFAQEQEILKIDLQRILSNEVSYQNEVRNALISFHSVIAEWTYSILEVGFGDYNKSNIESLISVRKNIASFYAKAGISQSKVRLLVEDSELIELALNLYSNTLEFHHWTDRQFLLLQQNCQNQKNLTNHFLVLMDDLEANKNLAKMLTKQEEKLEKERGTLFENYMLKRNKESAKLVPIEQEFSKEVKEYLRNN